MTQRGTAARDAAARDAAERDAAERAAAAPADEGRLTADTLVYGLGASGSQLVYVLFLPIFTRIFGPAQFGVLDFLVSVNSLLGVAALLGLNSAIFYFLKQTDDPDRRARIAGTAIVLTLTTGLVIAVVGVVGAPWLAVVLLGQTDQATAVAMACLWVPANVAATIGLDLLRIQFRPRTYAALSVGRSAIASVLGVVAAGPLGLGVTGLLAAHAGTTAIAALIGLWLTRSAWTFTVDRRAVAQIVPFGVPLVTFGVALWVIGFSDRYFVIQFLGTAAAGIYSLASRGAALVSLVVFAFEAAWLPLAMTLSRQTGHREAYARVFTTVGAGLVALAVVLSLFAREAIVLVATPAFASAAAYVGILALGQAIYGVGQVLAIGIQLGRRTGSLLWISGLAAAMNVALTIVLVPRIGIAGAAIATVVAYGLSTSLIYVMAQRAYPVPYPVRLVVLSMAIGTTAMAGGLLLDARTPPDTWLSGATLMKGVIAALTGGALWLIHRRRGGAVPRARTATSRRNLGVR